MSPSSIKFGHIFPTFHVSTTLSRTTSKWFLALEAMRAMHPLPSLAFTSPCLCFSNSRTTSTCPISFPRLGTHLHSANSPPCLHSSQLYANYLDMALSTCIEQSWEGIILGKFTFTLSCFNASPTTRRCDRSHWQAREPNDRRRL